MTILMMANSRRYVWQPYLMNITWSVFTELWMPGLPMLLILVFIYSAVFMSTKKLCCYKCFVSFNFVIIGLYKIYLTTKFSQSKVHTKRLRL